MGYLEYYRLEKPVLHYHGNLGFIPQPEDIYFSQFGLSEHRRLNPVPQGWGTKENPETVLSESYTGPGIVLFLMTLSHEILVMILSQQDLNAVPIYMEETED